MESVDYASHQASLNHRTTHVNNDGQILYIISPRDLGVQNWLDTSGWSQGSICARWTHCTENPHEVSTTVVKFDEIDQHLPVDTSRIDSEERKRVIALRQAAISRRYAGGS